MPTVRFAQTSWTAGEIAPTLAARIGVERYYAGAELLENFLVRPQGGVRRRPGMRHVALLDDAADGAIRLIPFAFNTEQTYLIALTDGRFRVWRADGLALADVTGCPWTGAEAAQLNWTQSADTLLLFHPNHPPQRIRRGAVETSWTRDVPALSNIPTHDYGAGAEPVISATRGWPECGTFHKGRLWLAGLRSRPATLLASVVGSFFDFNQGTALDDQAIYATIDSDQVNAIHQLVSGRTLQLFTSGSEITVDGDVITPKTFALREQTRRGIQRYARTAEVDGATLFVQRGGAALRSFLFSEAEQAWNADIASLLAPHLIQAPREPIIRKGVAQDDADHVLLPSGGDSMTVMTTLRAQEVAAFTRWITAGNIVAAAALASGEVYFAVRRALTLRIERWSQSSVLDASVVREEALPFTSISGTAHLTGTAELVLDGSYFGVVTVAGAASVTLPRPARRAEIGLGFTARLVTLPLEPRHPSGPMMGRRSRLAQIVARVNTAGTFLVQGRPAVLRQAGGPPAPPLDSPPPILTGDVTLRGFIGYRERQQITVEQPVPAPLELLALTSLLEFAD